MPTQYKDSCVLRHITLPTIMASARDANASFACMKAVDLHHVIIGNYDVVVGSVACLVSGREEKLG